MADNSENLNTSNDGDEVIVTMADVLKEEEMLQENVDAVLGPADDKNCTYNDGYLKRQALYACITCLPAEGPETAGVCLACSYHCHENHDLVELYTKRNFRCDCGNSRFKTSCSLNPIKNATNENNSYNQNFRGKYCTCSRPYPDPEDTLGEEMLQCVICEDWFHTRHLGSSVPSEDNYAEMICASCTEKLPFLQHYLGYSVRKPLKSNDHNESAADIDVNETDKTLDSSNIETLEVSEINGSPRQTKDQASTSSETPAVTNDVESGKNQTELLQSKNTDENTEECGKTEDDKKMVNGDDSVNKSKPEENKDNKDCLLINLKKLPAEEGATFWPEGFRKLLCTCTKCTEMYESLGVGFITDTDDTVEAYEAKGKQRRAGTPSDYERGMEALGSLDRVQQMEAIMNYNDMKTQLTEYLAKFAKNKKVVREEDIREFFSGMAARKKQKMDIPYNCR